MTTSYECILTDVRGSGERRTGVITLNRPKQLNALNDTLMDELGAALLAFAADNAKFGQPEIKLGITPGAGGTQRLPRAVGKAKAMDLVLTARMMDAGEAERAGLVSRVVPAAELLDVALAAAETICAFSAPSVRMAKEAVNRSFEVPLTDGIALERHLFHSLFATEDKNEGMAAFLAKRKAEFKHR
jgi:enoyl-CoA hydratase